MAATVHTLNMVEFEFLLIKITFLTLFIPFLSHSDTPSLQFLQDSERSFHQNKQSNQMLRRRALYQSDVKYIDVNIAVIAKSKLQLQAVLIWLSSRSSACMPGLSEGVSSMPVCISATFACPAFMQLFFLKFPGRAPRLAWITIPGPPAAAAASPASGGRCLEQPG